MKHRARSWLMVVGADALPGTAAAWRRVTRGPNASSNLGSYRRNGTTVEASRTRITSSTPTVLAWQVLVIPPGRQNHPTRLN